MRFVSVDEVQVDDDVVKDVGDGDGLEKALVMKYQNFETLLVRVNDEMRRK